jgi:hypothetical protein
MALEPKDDKVRTTLPHANLATNPFSPANVYATGKMKGAAISVKEMPSQPTIENKTEQ